MRLTPAAFEALAAQAIDALPAWVTARMDNVVILVEQAPTPEQRRAGRVAPGSSLLGLYEGVPLIGRGRGYQLVPPDRITLFQRALESYAADEAALAELIRHTVIHEVAHHFGFGEQALHDLGC